jgi:hypothetical protein
MTNECPFNNNKCVLWIDYQVAQVALQEAEELCSSNWNEINYLLDRVKLLESLLKENEIKIPE